ncbi:helix-turn-helix domain-containing protein [Myxococcus llanfairpwllgwyngyllgogerychwyrndrobwllllantysiliogogogochensis]|uniref:Helix-turn-helix domain-containing protein n=1 Tax=Myxococcus llanfairpwllgwyngyllgogerychwyrndrobwllllantysiliogogogochensis TaxID=2590453 RepID=A0A540WYE8_9BACT|nr:helix-turn-helix domain-containing protein [Myxococcus llanfairpwllgwyngyllgogerychwyrndrobwllllantysiliogogogochensis]TQF14041.1 helix-turn-helix domain-containing protein [Myxococcus llanfairpwllgwyngyllgogerychwyrndrobwllllantysiliogogogochensis]
MASLRFVLRAVHQGPERGKSMTEVELEAIRRIIREELTAVGATGDLLTTAEAAVMVRVSETTIKRWMREGLIARHGEGRTVRISKSQLLAVMARQESPAVSDAEIERMAEAALGRVG